VPVPFQLPGSALSASPSWATPPPAGAPTLGPGPVLVAGPSSETRKKAEGMKYSLVELKASVAELWSLISAPALVNVSRSNPNWLT
jgi:hypothetical protein